MSILAENINIKCSEKETTQKYWMGVFLYPPKVIGKILKRPPSPFVQHNYFNDNTKASRHKDFNTNNNKTFL